MPFVKRKSRPGPLQRLSDRRRSLALAGLAVGAVLGAALFRRGRRGEEDRSEPASAAPPPPSPPASPPSAAPSPPASAPASGPGVDEAPPPINAAPSIEPATGELSAEEASILAVLAQAGRSDDDRTAIAVAGSLDRDAAAVTGVLRKLGAEGVVTGEVYTASGDKIWAVTERGVRRLGAQN